MTSTEAPARSLILLLGAIAAVAPFAIDMYLPALPAIAADLHAADADLQRSVAAFLFGFALCQLIYGPLSDRVGRRPILLFGLVLFSLASLACALVDSAAELLIARLLQALGGGASAVVLNAVVRDRYQGTAAARVYSLIIMTMTLAPLLAPSLGGLVLRGFGWHAIFALLAALGGVLTLAVLLLLPETLPPERRRQQRWSELAAGYGHVLRHRHAMANLLGSSLAFGAMFAFISASPFVYIELFGASEQQYGLLFGVNILLLMTANTYNSRHVMRVGLRPMILLALLVQSGAALFLLLVTFLFTPTLPLIVLGCALFIGSIGLLAPNSSAAMLAPFEHHAGTASALLSSSRYLCGGLGASAVAALDDGSARPMVLMMACGALLALLCYVWLAERDEPASAPATSD